MLITVEHPETRQRMRVDDAAFDDPEAHPQNHDHIDYALTPGDAPNDEHHHPGRTGAERRSMKADGYIPVAFVDDRGREEMIGPFTTDQEWADMSLAEQDQRMAAALDAIKARKAKK